MKPKQPIYDYDFQVGKGKNSGIITVSGKNMAEARSILDHLLKTDDNVKFLVCLYEGNEVDVDKVG